MVTIFIVFGIISGICALLAWAAWAFEDDSGVNTILCALALTAFSFTLICSGLWASGRSDDSPALESVTYYAIELSPQEKINIDEHVKKHEECDSWEWIEPGQRSWRSDDILRTVMFYVEEDDIDIWRTLVEYIEAPLYENRYDALQARCEQFGGVWLSNRECVHMEDNGAYYGCDGILSDYDEHVAGNYMHFERVN